MTVERKENGSARGVHCPLARRQALHSIFHGGRSYPAHAAATRPRNSRFPLDSHVYSFFSSLSYSQIAYTHLFALVPPLPGIQEFVPTSVLFLFFCFFSVRSLWTQASISRDHCKVCSELFGIRGNQSTNPSINPTCPPHFLTSYFCTTQKNVRRRSVGSANVPLGDRGQRCHVPAGRFQWPREAQRCLGFNRWQVHFLLGSFGKS